MSCMRAWRTIFLLAAVILIVTGVSMRFYGAARARYAMSVGENPVHIHADRADGRREGLRRRVEVPVRNTGRLPFRIRQVETSCSCTVAGRVPGVSIAPGQQVTIPVEVYLPAYGEKSTRLTISTEGDVIPQTDVELRLHGPRSNGPYIQTSFSPVQLIAMVPGEEVGYSFDVVTSEPKLDGEHWLLGFQATSGAAKVEFVSVEDLQEIADVGFVIRRYRFQLRTVGPQSEDENITFLLRPVTRTPAIRTTPMPSFRCQLAPDTRTADM